MPRRVDCSDYSVVVVPFATVRRQRRKTTIAALMRLADGLPAPQVHAARVRYLDLADQLGGRGELAEARRYLVIAAVLLNREIFELAGIVQQVDFLL